MACFWSWATWAGAPWLCVLIPQARRQRFVLAPTSTRQRHPTLGVDACADAKVQEGGVRYCSLRRVDGLEGMPVPV